MLHETMKYYFDYYYHHHETNNQQSILQESLQFFSMASTPIAIYLSYLLYSITVFIIKAYVSFYLLSCCHEILEDHREGTINARSKSVHYLISIMMLSLTFLGLYGVYICHLGLILTWLLLKPFVRLLDLESPTLTLIVIVIICIGSIVCYKTYDTFNQYTSSPLF